MIKNFLKRNFIIKFICLFFVCLISLVILLNFDFFTEKKYVFPANKEDIEQVKSLLKDKYSKKCFRSYCRFYYSRLRDKTPHCFAKFDETEHPEVSIQKGDVILDIGVSGDTRMTEKMLLLTGRTGKVLGIEANPKLIGVINNKLKDYNNFKLYNYAVYSYDGVGVFDLGLEPDDEINFVGRIPDEYSKTKNQIYVNYITLDTFVKKYNIDKLDYIKMDIEAAEIEAMKASVQTLKKFKPKLAISCHDPGYVIDMIKFINSLDLGYDFYLAQIEAGSTENLYWRNYIVYANARK